MQGFEAALLSALPEDEPADAALDPTSASRMALATAVEAIAASAAQAPTHAELAWRCCERLCFLAQRPGLDAACVEAGALGAVASAMLAYQGVSRVQAAAAEVLVAICIGDDGANRYRAQTACAQGALGAVLAALAHPAAAEDEPLIISCCMALGVLVGPDQALAQEAVRMGARPEWLAVASAAVSSGVFAS